MHLPGPLPNAPHPFCAECPGSGHSTPDGVPQRQSRGGQLLPSPFWPPLFRCSSGYCWPTSIYLTSASEWLNSGENLWFPLCMAVALFTMTTLSSEVCNLLVKQSWGPSTLRSFYRGNTFTYDFVAIKQIKTMWWSSTMGWIFKCYHSFLIILSSF